MIVQAFLCRLKKSWSYSYSYSVGGMICFSYSRVFMIPYIPFIMTAAVDGLSYVLWSDRVVSCLRQGGRWEIAVILIAFFWVPFDRIFFVYFEAVKWSCIIFETFWFSLCLFKENEAGGRRGKSCDESKISILKFCTEIRERERATFACRG